MENKKSETALIKKVGDIANVMAAAGVGFTDYITQLTQLSHPYIGRECLIFQAISVAQLVY